MMSRIEFVILALFVTSCGDVPRAPKQVPAPVQPLPEAGPVDLDAAPSCEGSSRPTGPLPASMECVNCALDNCFDAGAACVGDPTCQSCISDVTMPVCAENMLWKLLLACLCDPMNGAPAACGGTCHVECLFR